MQEATERGGIQAEKLSRNSQDVSSVLLEIIFSVIGGPIASFS